MRFPSCTRETHHNRRALRSYSKYCKSDDDYRKRIEEENNFRAQIKQNNNFQPPRPNNYERRPFTPHNQVNQIKNDSNVTAQSEYTHQKQYNQRSQFNETTFERGNFGTTGRGKGKTPLKPKDMYCIIHGKGAGHTSEMYPKVKKSIEEAQKENRAQSQ
jgi:hypothetical protein